MERRLFVDFPQYTVPIANNVCSVFLFSGIRFTQLFRVQTNSAFFLNDESTRLI